LKEAESSYYVETETTIPTRHRDTGTGKFTIALLSVPSSVDVSGQTHPPLAANAAFILFNKQIAAHIAAQALTHDEPYCMSALQKYVEVAPEDVIWENLSMDHYDRCIRT
jgi:calcium permeable stress-gated cation channel